MRILLVAATVQEASSIVPAQTVQAPDGSRVASVTLAGHAVDLLVTGVGMVATAAWCSRTFAEDPHYDLALNIGVCGAFDPAIALGSVVHVVSDRIAELGAEDGDAFIALEDLGLSGQEARPFARTPLVNSAPPTNAELSSLQAVSGITVNTVHGSDASIHAVRDRFNPQVESMEGAAFMFACMMTGVPFAQVRGVSNVVERRNRDGWRLSEAISNVGAVALRIIEAL